MLRSRCDSFGDHPLVVVDGDRVEQLPAKLCEQADGGNGLLHAPPAVAGPVQHRPYQRQAGPLAGEAADDLHPLAGLAEGALDEFGVVVSLLGHTALQQQLAMAVAEHVRVVSPDNERGGNR